MNEKADYYEDVIVFSTSCKLTRVYEDYKKKLITEKERDDKIKVIKDKYVKDSLDYYYPKKEETKVKPIKIKDKTNSMYGKHHTQESKDKMSRAKKNMSFETKEKIRKAMTGNQYAKKDCKDPITRMIRKSYVDYNELYGFGRKKRVWATLSKEEKLKVGCPKHIKFKVKVLGDFGVYKTIYPYAHIK